MDEPVSVGRRMLEHEEIARSNVLITARYKATLTENKMTVLALKRSSFDEHGRHVATFTASELKRIMGHSNGSFYQQLKDTAKKMQNRQLAIEDIESKKFKFMSIIDTADFDNGIFTVAFNPDVNKYIDNLKNSFTIMNMGILVDFTSTYAYRLYEILKAQEYLIDLKGDINGEYLTSYGVSELKVAVGCVDTASPAVQQELGRKNPDYDKIVEVLATDRHFDKWYDFKKNVLDVAMNQINEKSDIVMRYELNRSGRGGKVQRVDIYISHNPAYSDSKEREHEIPINENISVVGKNQNIINRLSEIIDYMEEYPVSVEEANLFLKKANFNVERVKDAYDYVRTKKNVKDFVSYMVDAITNGYAAPNEARSKGRFRQAGNHLKVEENSQISFDDISFEDDESVGGFEPAEDEDLQVQPQKRAQNSQAVEMEKSKDAIKEKAEEDITSNTKSSKEADEMAMELINGMTEDSSWKAFLDGLELPYDLILQVKGAKWLLWKFTDWKKKQNEK